MNLSTMTLAQLGYLVAVDRYRSFREAAASCHVTQPALSQQVQKLEEALGGRVFDRSRQPIVPTELGARVLTQARIVLREAERMGDVVTEATGAVAGRYRLGIIPTLAPTLLPLVLPRFVRKHPAVELVIEELQTEVLVARLEEDTLDGGLAATPLHARRIHERPLYREPFSVYVAANHPLAKRPRVGQRELAEQSVWIMAEGHCFREQVLQLCQGERVVSAPGGGSVEFVSGTFETLIRLVDANFGLTVLPELVIRALPAAQRKRHVRPFVPPVPVREVSFVHSRDHLRRAVADALVAELVASLPEDLRVSERRPPSGERVLAPVS